MAEEDDLDAFFDEVSEVEAKVVQDGDTEKTAKDEKQTTTTNQAEAEKKDDAEETEPPAKRMKTSVAVRPRGVVVASSTSVVIPAKEREEKAAEQLEQQQQQTQYPPSKPSGPLHMQQRSPTTIGPSAPAIGPAFPGATNPSLNDPNAQGPQKAVGPHKKVAVRMAAGKKWVDESLDEWPDNDYRIFVGNLSNEVTDIMLFQHFQKYPSLARAKVVRHNNDPDKSKGYGFVSLLDPLECARAIREMDQTWVGSRPIRIKRSDWKDRDFKNAKKKQQKEKTKQKRAGMRIY